MKLEWTNYAPQLDRAATPFGYYKVDRKNSLWCFEQEPFQPSDYPKLAAQRDYRRRLAEATGLTHDPQYWNGKLARTPYFVLPRLAIQAMPEDWQARLAQLIDEADEMNMETPAYQVFRDGDFLEPGEGDVKHVKTVNHETGFCRIGGRLGDPWANYRYGRISELCPGFSIKVT